MNDLVAAFHGFWVGGLDVVGLVVMRLTRMTGFCWHDPPGEFRIRSTGRGGSDPVSAMLDTRGASGYNVVVMKGQFMPKPLPEGLIDLLRKASPCFVATLMPDGSPQLTQTWVDTDGENIVLNIVEGMQKARNLERDPRVAINIVDGEDVSRFYAVRGRVISTTTEGGRESIDAISQKYLGIPYPNFSGNPNETRLIVTIGADKVTLPPGEG